MTETENNVQVLLVDDEENILKSLKRLFMDEDFELHTANLGGTGTSHVEGTCQCWVDRIRPTHARHEWR